MHGGGYILFFRLRFLENYCIITVYIMLFGRMNVCSESRPTRGKEEKNMKKAIAIVLLAVMILGLLAACGGGNSGDKKLLGTYKLYMLADMTIQEYADLFEVSVEEAEKTMTLELKSGGKAVFTSDGEGETVDWKVEGEKLVLSAEGETLEGTIKDGIITLDFDGESIQLKK